MVLCNYTLQKIFGRVLSKNIEEVAVVTAKKEVANLTKKKGSIPFRVFKYFLFTFTSIFRFLHF